MSSWVSLGLLGNGHLPNCYLDIFHLWGLSFYTLRSENMSHVSKTLWLARASLTAPIKHLKLSLWCLTCRNYSFIPFFPWHFLLLHCQCLWETWPLSFPWTLANMNLSDPIGLTQPNPSQEQANHLKFTLWIPHMQGPRWKDKCLNVPNSFLSLSQWSETCST